MARDEVTLRVLRYRPEGREPPRWQEYRVPYRRDMVVLDALNYVKDRIDPTLTFRWSCRMGICGSCGMNVNGEPKLTCETFLHEVRRDDGIVVEPLSGFPVLKDLVILMDDFLGRLHDVKPWILRAEEKPLSEGEYLQTPEEVEMYKQQSMCINCMLCYAACPVYAVHPEFLGPAAAALGYRYLMDSRDQGKEERFRLLANDVGVWECTFVGECSVVCPKEVDPAGAIQKLKAMSAQHAMLSFLMPKARRR
jgi:fumarate reductase iron-sulfur subunit